MAWRFRRSRRLPGGFRLNLSKSGLGYSWGFRGFRIGRDSLGRVVRTLSVPGTGLYNRQYLSSGNSQAQNSGMDLGACLPAALVLLVALALFSYTFVSGNLAGMVLSLVVLVGYLVVQFRRRTTVEPGQTAQPNYEELGREVRSLFVELATPLKNELRKSRGATAYEAVFEMAFMDLMCRVAAADGPINSSEGKVFLDVFKVLHPKKYGGLLPEDGATLLDGHRQSHPENLQVPIQDCLLLKYAEEAGGSYANNLKELMCKVALQVALADGPLSASEQVELEALRNAGSTLPPPLPNGTPVSEAASVPGPEREVNEPPSGLVEPGSHQPATPTEGLQPELPKVEEGTSGDTAAPLVSLLSALSPSPSAAALSFESVIETATEFFVQLEALLKVEMRKIRQASVARDLLEQDVTAVIVRFGIVDGVTSKDAANVYLQLFKRLHPKTYGGWTVDSVATFIQRLTAISRDTYLGPLKRPRTLGFVESFDAEHGTAFAKTTRDLLLALAVFAASVDGKVSGDRAAELERFKAVLEANAGR